MNSLSLAISHGLFRKSLGALKSPGTTDRASAIAIVPETLLKNKTKALKAFPAFLFLTLFTNVSQDFFFFFLLYPLNFLYLISGGAGLGWKDNVKWSEVSYLHGSQLQEGFSQTQEHWALTSWREGKGFAPSSADSLQHVDCRSLLPLSQEPSTYLQGYNWNQKRGRLGSFLPSDLTGRKLLKLKPPLYAFKKFFTRFSCNFCLCFRVLPVHPPAVLNGCPCVFIRFFALFLLPSLKLELKQAQLNSMNIFRLVFQLRDGR